MEYVANTFQVGSAKVQIINDPDGGQVWNPGEDDDAMIMAMLHDRYINPAAKRGLDSPEAIAEFARDNADEWREFPLYMYDHSGTVYRVGETGNPFAGNLPQGHAEFDSGRVGSLFVKLADVGDDPRAAADSFCKVYTDWANGNIWGYVAETPDGEDESCWGFIGDSDEPYLIETATEAAKRLADSYDTATARALEATRPDMYADAR